MSYLRVALIFLRMLGLFLLVPGFSHKAIPGTVKVLFALSFALVMFPILSPKLALLPTSTEGLVAVALRETVLGMLMGFVAYATFEGIHLAAQFIGYQLGFGTVGLIDPVNHAQVSPLVPLHGWIALLLFFATDLHHWVLQLFFSSFVVTESMDLGVLGGMPLFNLLTATTADIFVIAIKMAAPFTLLVLASNAAIGILSRMLPQMQVLIFSFPITILLGLLALYWVTPATGDNIGLVFESLWTRWVLLLKLF